MIKRPQNQRKNMELYVIPSALASLKELKAAGAKSAIGNEEMADRVRRNGSYVVNTDGRIGTICVYSMAASLRSHLR
jgi:hypothetical protein